MKLISVQTIVILFCISWTVPIIAYYRDIPELNIVTYFTAPAFLLVWLIKIKKDNY